jgi:hypothetical protein
MRRHHGRAPAWRRGDRRQRRLRLARWRRRRHILWRRRSRRPRPQRWRWHQLRLPLLLLDDHLRLFPGRARPRLQLHGRGGDVPWPVRRASRPLGPRAAPGEDEVGGPRHALHRLRHVGTRRGERGDAADGALRPPDRLDVVPSLRRSDDGRRRRRRDGQRRAVLVLVQRGAARRQQVHLPHQVLHDLGLAGAPPRKNSSPCALRTCNKGELKRG